jgi:hypothetical protein
MLVSADGSCARGGDHSIQLTSGGNFMTYNGRRNRLLGIDLGAVQDQPFSSLLKQIGSQPVESVWGAREPARRRLPTALDLADPEGTARRPWSRASVTDDDGQNQQSRSRHRLGDLSATRESRGDPGSVNPGRGDAGGASYGIFQFSTNSGNATRFLESQEGRPWAAQFAGTRPGTPEFGTRWQQVAAQNPEAFGDAQHSFWTRQTYTPVVERVQRNTGFDLNGAGDAVRDAAWSMIVQHGEAPNLIRDAIRRTDEHLDRTDPNYRRVLIDNLYDRREEHVRDVRDREQRAGNRQRAHNLQNVLDDRLPRERADAHRMLREARTP